MNMKLLFLSINFISLLLTAQICANNFDHLLDTNNVIEVKVYGENELSRTVIISSRGTLKLPLIGELYVLNKTSYELEELFKKKYSDFLVKPEVSVLIIDYGSVAVTGQVKREGAYALKAGMTVLEAVAISGGFTKIASKNNVLLIRKDGTKINIRFSDINKNGDISKNIPLRNGDILFVPETFF
jgi:protein involved in polysaccharide export with SLBB domain